MSGQPIAVIDGRLACRDGVQAVLSAAFGSRSLVEARQALAGGNLLRGYTFKFVQRAITNNAQLPQFEIQPHDETHLRLQDLESVRQSGVLCIIITGHASPDLLCPCGGVFVRVHHSNKLTFSATISKVVEHGAVNAAISDIVRTSLQCVGGCGGLNCKGNLAVNEIMNLLLKIEAALTQPQLMAAAAQGGGASGAAMFAIRYN